MGHAHAHHPSPTTRLWGFVRNEKRDLWVAIIYSVFIGLLSLVVPLATQMLVNTVAFGSLMQPVVVLTLVVLAGLGFAGALQVMRAWVVEIIQRRFFVRIGSDLVHRLLRVNAESFDRHHGPELVNRFFEVVTVQKGGALLLIDGLSLFMQTMLGMLLLAIYHPYLLVFDIVLLVVILMILFFGGRGAVSTSISESQAKYEVVAWLEELARHLITFHSGHGSAYAIRRADQLFSRYVRYRIEHFRILIRQKMGFLGLQAVASAGLLGVGGWLVIERQLTLGQLIAAELVVTAILSSLAKYSKYLETYYDLVAATDKLGYLEDIVVERTGSDLIATRGKGVTYRLKNVTYGYLGRPGVLNDLDWNIEPGVNIGLTGDSGKGKSTLLDLLYGLRIPASGVVEIDDHDLRQMDLLSVRSRIALVRSTEIFHGTIEDNLRLGNMDATTVEIRRALAGVGLLDEISTLPDGPQTELATGGKPLSSGQAIRLLLARAILSSPRLIIIDEALDQIDDAVERDLLLDVLFDAAAPWSVLVATEDSVVLKRCDQVFELDHGQIYARSLTSWK
jgi:putative ABC transport system ATP-binding protein